MCGCVPVREHEKPLEGEGLKKQERRSHRNWVLQDRKELAWGIRIGAPLTSWSSFTWWAGLLTRPASPFSAGIPIYGSEEKGLQPALYPEATSLEITSELSKALVNPLSSPGAFFRRLGEPVLTTACVTETARDGVSAHPPHRHGALSAPSGAGRWVPGLRESSV